MSRFIRVTGKGTVRVKPDTTRLIITIEGIEKEYDKALRRTAEETQILQEILQELGFEREDLKTLNLDISPKYDSVYNEKRRKYDETFIGYNYDHELKLEFPLDNSVLGKVLSALAASPIKPTFSILYTVRDQEQVKNSLLAKAVTDATEKAKVLAKAAGVTLKDIQTIDYSWGEVRFETSIVEGSSTLAREPDPFESIDITPDDIEQSDTVTVVWGIE